MGHLIETVLCRDGPDGHRLKQDVISAISAHLGSPHPAWPYEQAPSRRVQQFPGNYARNLCETANEGQPKHARITLEPPFGGDDTIRITDNAGVDQIDGGSGGADNDFIDLSPYYSNLLELRADLADDGVLKQSDGDFSDNTSMGGGGLTFTGADESSFTTDIVCFTAGTAISIPKGTVLIETLKVGDLVLTADNGPQPIRWIGRRDLDQTALLRVPKLRPVLIKQGGFAKHANAAGFATARPNDWRGQAGARQTPCRTYARCPDRAWQTPRQRASFPDQ